MNWIEQMAEDSHRSRQHVNLSPDDVPPVPVAVRAPKPTSVPRHSLLAWGVVLLGMAGVIFLAWWLTGVHFDF